MTDSMSVYGSNPRTTLDGEWTEEELADDVYDECMKWLDRYRGKYLDRAVYDKDLLKQAYLAEKIKNENDLVEVYNREYDKHRNEKVFGIHWFDKWVEKQIKRILNDNLVGNAK